MDLKDTFLSLPNWGRISLVGGAGILGIMMLSKQSKSAESFNAEVSDCPSCGSDNWGESEDYTCRDCGERFNPYAEYFSAEAFGADELSHDDKATMIYEGIQQNLNNPEAVRYYYELFYGETPADDYEGDMALDVIEAVQQNLNVESFVEYVYDELYGGPIPTVAESFEADAEGEEEFKGYHENDCHICERPYDFSKIARGLVQHYLKESDNGTNDWKTKGNPDGTRRTARNVAGSELYWYGLEALEHYMAKGKESKIKPLVIDLIRKAIVPNVIAGDVHSFIESLEIEGIDIEESMLSKEEQEKWRAEEFGAEVMMDFRCPYCDWDVGQRIEDNIEDVRWLNERDIPNEVKCIHCGKESKLTNEGGGYYYDYDAESFGVEEVMCNECLWGGSHNELIPSEDEFGNYSGCPKCQSDNLIDFTGQNKYAEEFEAEKSNCVRCNKHPKKAGESVCKICYESGSGYFDRAGNDLADDFEWPDDEEFEARTYRKTPTRSKGESKSKIDAKRRRYRQSQTARKSNAESFEARVYDKYQLYVIYPDGKEEVYGEYESMEDAEADIKEDKNNQLDYRITTKDNRPPSRKHWFGAEFFEASQKKTRLNSKQKKQRYVSNKIKKIMRDWKKSGKIGTSTPKNSKAAQRQAIAVAYSFAERQGHGAESNYFKEVHCNCGAQLHWDNVSKHWFCSACGYSAKKTKGLQFNSESDYLEMRQEHGDHDDAHNIIEDLDKLTAFCITFLDDGAYGGESQGLKDAGGGLKEEIVLYVEGSIQMKFVYDSEGQNIAIRVKYTHDPHSPVIYLPKAAFIATKPDDIEEHH